MMLSPRKPKISTHSPTSKEFLGIKGGYSLPPKNTPVLQRPPHTGIQWSQVPGKVRPVRPVFKVRGGIAFNCDFQLNFGELLSSILIQKIGVLFPDDSHSGVREGSTPIVPAPDHFSATLDMARSRLKAKQTTQHKAHNSWFQFLSHCASEFTGVNREAMRAAATLWGGIKSHREPLARDQRPQRRQPRASRRALF